MMIKLLIGMSIAFSSLMLFGQNCPDDINNSPGNSPNVVTATVYDSGGNEIQDITCQATGNSNQLDCDLDSYNFPSGSFVLIEISNGPNTTTCAYDENGELLTNNPLPVELVAFEVQANGDQNQLNWKTASETNNDYFTLHHSRDGLDWRSIEQIEGRGTTSEESDYTYLHHRVKAGMNYYRLMQTDFNGQTEVLGVKAIRNTGCSVTQKGDRLEISSDQEIVNVKCTLPTGQRVVNKQIQSENLVRIQKNNFSASFMICQVLFDDGTMVRRKIFVD
ncbi:MAG: hypothetical protein ACQERC_02295 [Bacteroidota bacterium]